MPGADAGLVVYWSYTRVRGQSQAPPGVPRMSSYLRDRPLSPAHGRRGRGWESVASYEAAPARLAEGDVADRLVGPVHLAYRAPVEQRGRGAHGRILRSGPEPRQTEPRGGA